jgi:predicted GNAT family acetyltransferase
MDQTTVTVTHDPVASRFVAVVDGLRCVADYELVGNVMWMTHTGVPYALRGRGIAAQLVAAALAFAREHGFLVQPQWSYVATYMRRHPETLDLIAR